MFNIFTPKQKSVEEPMSDMNEDKLDVEQAEKKKEIAFMTAYDARKLFYDVFCDIIGVIERVIAMEALHGKSQADLYPLDFEGSSETLDDMCDVIIVPEIILEIVIPFLQERGYDVEMWEGTILRISWSESRAY